MIREPQVDPEEDPVLARAVAGTYRDDWRPAADAMSSAGDRDRRARITEVLAAARRVAGELAQGAAGRP